MNKNQLAEKLINGIEEIGDLSALRLFGSKSLNNKTHRISITQDVLKSMELTPVQIQAALDQIDGILTSERNHWIGNEQKS